MPPKPSNQRKKTTKYEDDPDFEMSDDGQLAGLQSQKSNKPDPLTLQITSVLNDFK